MKAVRVFIGEKPGDKNMGIANFKVEDEDAFAEAYEVAKELRAKAQKKNPKAKLLMIAVVGDC